MVGFHGNLAVMIKLQNKVNATLTTLSRISITILNKTALKGVYRVYVYYYSGNQNKLGLKTKVNVRVIHEWGTAKEREESAIVALESESEKQIVFKTRVDL